MPIWMQRSVTSELFDPIPGLFFGIPTYVNGKLTRGRRKAKDRLLAIIFITQNHAGLIQVEGSKNRWLMRLVRDFRLLAI